MKFLTQNMENALFVWANEPISCFLIHHIDFLEYNSINKHYYLIQ